jgi:ribulose-phosphate 3-epimerase
VFPLQWPTAPDGTLSANAMIGVGVEPVAELAAKESAKLGSKETFAKRVAMDLFRYMESFQAATAVSADHMVVPMNVLDRWFTKFQDKFRRDPDFLTARRREGLTTTTNRRVHVAMCGRRIRSDNSY